jgi:hypothetical protein
MENKIAISIYREIYLWSRWSRMEKGIQEL